MADRKKDRKWTLFGRGRRDTLEDKEPEPELSHALEKLSVNLDGQAKELAVAAAPPPSRERVVAVIDYANGPWALFKHASKGETDLLQIYGSARTQSIRDCINVGLDEFNNTALHFAVSMNDTALIAVLLLKGADPNARNKSGVRPTSIAKRLGLKEALALLRKHGGELPSEDDELSRLFIQSINPRIQRQNQISRKRRVKLNSQQYALFAPELVLEHSPTSRLIHRLHDTSFVKRELNLLQAAYLGLINQEHLAAIPPQSLNMVDENGHTPLAKAAYKGHTETVRLLVEAGASLKILDNRGQCVLVWASYGGHEEVVAYLLSQKMPVDGFGSLGPGSDGVYGVTPLIAAVYARSLDVISTLLDAGANINKGIGFKDDTIYKNPLLFACWLKYEEIVATLLVRGAKVLPDYPVKIRKGLLLSKYITLRGHSLEEPHPLYLAPTEPFGLKLPQLSYADGMTLERKMEVFSTDEIKVLNSLELMIKSGKDRAEKYLKEIGLNVIKQTEEEKKVSDMKTHDDEVEVRFRYREKLNLDKQVDPYLDAIMDLTQQIPSEGTVLDTHWIATVQCVLELVSATSLDRKAEYVKHSAQIIHQSTELVKAIEHVFPTDDGRENKGHTKDATDIQRKVLKTTGPGLLVFEDSPVRVLIVAIVKKISTELPKQLLLATRISVGVWPPPSSKSDMIQAAAELAKACKVLADVCNAVGYFDLTVKDLKFRFENYTHNDTAVGIHDSKMSYEEYKRANDVKLLEKISMASPAPVAEDKTSADEMTKFNQRLDQLVKSFVSAMADLKKATDDYMKDDYISLSGLVAQQSELLIEEVQTNSVLSDIPQDALFDENTGSFLLGKDFTSFNISSLPVAVAIVFREGKVQVRQATLRLIQRSSPAAAMDSDSAAAADMINSSIICVMTIKRLVTVSKAAYGVVKKIKEHDVRYGNQLQRDIAASQSIRRLFDVWESTISKTNAEDPTIIIESSILADDEDGLDFEASGSTRLIKGGRLPKLVEYLTSHNIKDDDFQDAFLLSHHSFTTSLELLDLLAKRYDLRAPAGLTKEQYDTFINKKLFPVKQKVWKVLRQWLLNHFDEDFRSNEILVFKVRDFIVEKIEKDSQAAAKEMMRVIISRIKTDATQSAKRMVVEDVTKGNPGTAPKIVLPSSLTLSGVYMHLTAGGPYAYLDFDPQEFARQFAILDFSYFKRVKIDECADEIWGDRRKKELGALGLSMPAYHGQGLAEIIKRTNVLSFWIATNILKADNVKIRVKIMAFFVQIAIFSRELNNYNAVTTINAALVMSPISRLKKTWEAFKEKYPRLNELYEETVAIVSPRGQYAAYRKVLKEIVPPAVPFLGVTLTDLTFTELGNPDYLPDTIAHINFDKRRKVFQVLETTLMKYQVTPYHLTPIQGIIDFLMNIGQIEPIAMAQEAYLALNADKNMDKRKTYSTALEVTMDADTLYDSSLIVEPREEELSDDDNAA